MGQKYFMGVKTCRIFSVKCVTNIGCDIVLSLISFTHLINNPYHGELFVQETITSMAKTNVQGKNNF